MREPARDKGRLADILEAAAYIKQFTDGVEYPSFLSDKLRYFAVLKNAEIVGEAAYMLSSEFKELHPDLPWSQMIKMRHVLVHGYASILPEVLWETATKEIPDVIPRIEALYSLM